MKYEIDFRTLNLDKLNKAMESVTKIDDGFKKFSSNLEDSRNKMKGVADFKFIRFFDSMEDKLLSIARRQAILADRGGAFGIIKDKASEFFAILSGGTGTMKNAAAGALALGKNLLSHASIYAGIAVASTIAMKIWQENIGNVQGLWIKFVGNLKNIWAKGDVRLRRALRSFGDELGEIFKRVFALAEGFVEGFLDGTAALLDALAPLGIALKKIFSLFGKGGQESIDKWNSIGKAIGAVLPAILGLFVIVKLIAIVKAITGAFIILNAVMTANPVGAIIVGIVALVALVVYLQKRFNIFGRALEGWIILFKLLFKGIMISIKTMLIPIMAAIKAYKTVKGFLTKDKEGEAEGGMSDNQKKAILTSSGSNSTSNDNRSSNVTVYTQSLDSRNARNIGSSLIDPTMQANKNF